MKKTILIATLAFFASLTHAELVTYSFTGEVTVVQSFGSADLSDDFMVGQSVTGTFTVDTSVPDSNDAINSGRFDGAIVNFELDVGGYLVSDTGASRIDATDNVTPVPFPVGDYISSSLIQTTGGPIDGVDFSQINMLLGDFTNTAFDAQDPNSLSPNWDLNMFPDLGFFLEWIRFERRRGGSAVGGAIEVSNLSFEILGPCLADLTGEGDLNFLDVSAFLTAYGNQDPAADFRPDGSFNFLDVSAFLDAFGKGCP